MVVRGSAAPPTPWSKNLVQPKIDETAYVHSFSNIVGEVYIGAKVLVAPGTSIRADEGSAFRIGESSNIQDGVVIHGLEQGRVIGDDQKQYSVWIGKNTAITHMALVHGPAYVGDDCFIGFRSTVFNARVGQGCIVMMHVLIQDVEIPPGKFVPSGSIITTQQQADRLPDVRSIDVQFVNQMMGINNALRLGDRSANQVVPMTAVHRRVDIPSNVPSSTRSSQDTNQMQNTHLDPEVVNQVRQLLSSGYRIGTEHADTRRFQTSSWQSCAPIMASRESEVLSALQGCLMEHNGEYVRLFGIDTQSKRRISEMIIQRPGNNMNGRSPAPTPQPSYSSSTSSPTSHSSYASSGSLSPEIVEQVRQFVRQGYRIGAEHADQRRFQTSSWQSCPPISTTNESEVLTSLERCLAEHNGEYIRLFGIDTHSKRRIQETIVQRPGGRSNGSASAPSPSRPTSNATSATSSYSTSSSSSPSAKAGLSAEVVDQIRQLLSQGYRIGTEHADTRRFQTSSWQSCAPITSTRDSDVFAALEACMQEHAGEYVRLFGIDTKSKRRIAETIVQRP